METKPKILIVDDRRENLIALETILKDIDVDIVCAESGNEALKRLINNEFALVLMDVQMPDMDGYETVALMRQDDKFRQLPVIFLSAVYRDDEHKIKGTRQGAIDFMTKPFVPEILRGKVKIFLELYQNRMAIQRNLELRVSKRTAQLEEANKELEDFVYSLSHDLRAPLRSISGFAEIINRRHKASLNEEGQHYFDNIVKASRQMEELIDDLLKFSRLSRKPITPVDVSLNDALKIAIETVSDSIEKTNARIKIPDQMPGIQGDLTLMTQIFINLLENAVKYCKPNEPPRIDISFKTIDQYVEVSLTDNGIGIEPEYHAKVFNMFQKLHSRKNYPGTGIGLTAAKKAVQLMDGKMWVESEPGKGSVFKLQLLKATTAS